jgi:hypothetical protein
MRKGETLYTPLREKNLKYAQMNLLSERFDFGRESWLAEHVVEKFNTLMNNYEDRNDKKRINPYEVVIEYQKHKITLPLLTPKAVDELVNGKTYSKVFKGIQKESLAILKKINEKSRIADVNKLISHRYLIPHHGGKRKVETTRSGYKTAKGAMKKVNLNIIAKDSQKIKIKLDGEIPIQIKTQMLNFLCRDERFSNARATALLQELSALRESYCPLIDELKAGQAVWICISTGDRQQKEKRTLYRKQLAVVLDLFTESEKAILEDPSLDLHTLNKLHQQIIARITTQAYIQGGLLSTIDLQFLLMRGQRLMSDLITKYEKETQIILPTPGSIKDSGRKQTHKRQIIDMHLKGMLNQKIARITCHSPEAIDRYISDFQSTLVLYIYDVPAHLGCRVMGCGISLVKEHLAIVKEYFPDKDNVKAYLLRNNIKFGS